jgi:hypothetical protein
MRTGTNNPIDDERVEGEFRRVLGMYGEPNNPEPPTDFVVRTARRLPDQLPIVLLRQQRFLFALRILLFLCFGLLVVLGAWLLLSPGPAAVLLGNGQHGISRTLLTVQLLLKPIRALIQMVGVPALVVGLLAAVASLYLAGRRTPLTQNLRAGT